ncbi:PAS domain-containing sensor histidine kinase [Zoogloea sp.]|uniref:PAS domain-containing sensor histidine kinase n=1 Tax=Zoogloea sp. TaxID=49181 RepID=UPI0026292144|nr:PAS domain-containing sensor histidine kinase [uncultured Zoogloea sp.]
MPDSVSPGLLISALLLVLAALAPAAWARRHGRNEARRLDELLQAETARRQAAEHALDEAHARFAGLFELLPELLVLSTGEEGRLIDMNHNWTSLLGYRRDESLGRSGDDFGLWGSPDEARGIRAELRAGGTVSKRPVTLRRSDGVAIEALLSARPLQIGARSYMITAYRDITTELAATRRLTESEARFAAIFNSAPCALSLTRMSDRGHVDANPAWEQLFGLDRSAVRNRSAIELGLWVDLDEQRAVYARIAGKEHIVQREVRLHLPGRQGTATCLISGRLLKVDGEECALWSVVDITELRRIQRDIEELNRTLEQRVAERTAELSSALDALRHTQEELIRNDKMAALGSLVAGIAHELNTPIGNSVTIATTLAAHAQELGEQHASGRLRRSDFDSHLEATREATGLLMRSLSRAEELVRSFKQVAVDQTSEQRRRFELGGFLREMAITLSPMFKNGPYLLEIAPLDPVQMDSYPGALGQIFTNLLSNALLHAFDGRPRGRIRVTPRQLEPGWVEIRFDDDGNGIPAANLRRIFDPFFTTRLGKGGSGLGLHIVYNLSTRLLGGRIDVSSAPGQGSCFVLSLPCTAPTSPPEDSRQLRAARQDALNFEDVGPII